jgi:hypothetical protein
MTPLAREMFAVCHAVSDDGTRRFSPNDVVEALPFIFLLGIPNEGEVPVPAELQQLLDPPTASATRATLATAIRGHYARCPPRSNLLNELCTLVRTRAGEAPDHVDRIADVLGASRVPPRPVGGSAKDPTRRFSLKVPGEER